MTLALGTPAPDASGLLQDGSTFHVRDARGAPLVLFFYPKDFTLGCTAEVCGFRDAFAELSGEGGARIVGVSRDDAASHRRFIAEHNLTYDLLADTDGSVHAAYGAKRTGLISIARRITYVIDAGGIVRGVFHHELRIGGHVADVRKCLAELRAAAR